MDDHHLHRLAVTNSLLSLDCPCTERRRKPDDEKPEHSPATSAISGDRLSFICSGSTRLLRRRLLLRVWVWFLVRLLPWTRPDLEWELNFEDFWVVARGIINSSPTQSRQQALENEVSVTIPETSKGKPREASLKLSV